MTYADMGTALAVAGAVLFWVSVALAAFGLAQRPVGADVEAAVATATYKHNEKLRRFAHWHDPSHQENLRTRLQTAERRAASHQSRDVSRFMAMGRPTPDDQLRHAKQALRTPEGIENEDAIRAERDGIATDIRTAYRRTHQFCYLGVVAAVTALLLGGAGCFLLQFGSTLS